MLQERITGILDFIFLPTLQTWTENEFGNVKPSAFKRKQTQGARKHSSKTASTFRITSLYFQLLLLRGSKKTYRFSKEKKTFILFSF